MAILTPVPLNFQQKIRSELGEILQLSYADIMPTVIHLRVSTQGPGGPPATTTPIDQSDQFRIPGDYNLLVSEVRSHVALNNLSTEDARAANGFTGMMLDATVRGRVIAKALNAKVSLFNADRNNLNFVENNLQNSSLVSGSLLSNLCLATLLPMAGGAPLKLIDQNYVMPLIVPGNERIQMQVSFRNAAATTGLTEYGLVLMGALVRSRVG
jgi:hypothetical protein